MQAFCCALLQAAGVTESPEQEAQAAPESAGAVAAPPDVDTQHGQVNAAPMAIPSLHHRPALRQIRTRSEPLAGSGRRSLLPVSESLFAKEWGKPDRLSSHLLAEQASSSMERQVPFEVSSASDLCRSSSAQHALRQPSLQDWIPGRSPPVGSLGRVFDQAIAVVHGSPVAEQQQPQQLAVPAAAVSRSPGAAGTGPIQITLPAGTLKLGSTGPGLGGAVTPGPQQPVVPYSRPVQSKTPGRVCGVRLSSAGARCPRPGSGSKSPQPKRSRSPDTPQQLASLDSTSPVTPPHSPKSPRLLYSTASARGRSAPAAGAPAGLLQQQFQSPDRGQLPSILAAFREGTPAS